MLIYLGYVGIKRRGEKDNKSEKMSVTGDRVKIPWAFFVRLLLFFCLKLFHKKFKCVKKRNI